MLRTLSIMHAADAFDEAPHDAALEGRLRRLAHGGFRKRQGHVRQLCGAPTERLLHEGGSCPNGAPLVDVVPVDHFVVDRRPGVHDEHALGTVASLR